MDVRVHRYPISKMLTKYPMRRIVSEGDQSSEGEHYFLYELGICYNFCNYIMTTFLELLTTGVAGQFFGAVEFSSTARTQMSNFIPSDLTFSLWTDVIKLGT